MRVTAITTGTVRITSRWQQNTGGAAKRLLSSLLDPNLTDPLPIWCYLIEHPEGVILVDAGILASANDPIWFPPYIRLLQRAAPFQISSPDEEIGPQIRRLGYALDDVRWVVLTHLHQDHEGGLHYFPKAEFVVSQQEWNAAQGLSGRLAGYMNQRWPQTFAPRAITFPEHDSIFGQRHSLTKAGDAYLVPTVGHSPGHMSLIVEEADHALLFAGDTAYSQDFLLADVIDGVGASADDQHKTHRRILNFAAAHPTVYLPSHEWAARERLAQREALPVQVRA